MSDLKDFQETKMENKNLIIKKLVSIQQELKVGKDRSALQGRYHYRSADDILAAVKPLLKKHKCALVISDDIVHFADEGKNYSKGLDKFGKETITSYAASRFYIKAEAVLYCEETGESIESTGLARENFEKIGMDVAQLTGSSSSYARKYALGGLFGLDDESDADDLQKDK